MSRKENNVNDSFNNVWTSVPKNVFVESHSLKLGLYEAVVIFTTGNACRLEELRGKTAVEKRSKLIKQSYKPRYYLKKQDFWKDEREFI